MKKVFWLLLVCIVFTSCARVGSPVGGAKDTIPPKFLGSNIDTTRINVPVDIKEVRLEFDEYVKLKDIQKNLIISPPIKKITKILPSNLATKYVSIQFEDTLKDNTTYQFNFGNAIQDYNESNVLRYFNFAFSTGDTINETYISGEVSDVFSFNENSNSANNKNVVGLYLHNDSIDYKSKPYYISRVDEDGYFELEYLTPGKYQLIAFTDENENSIYDPGLEKIGFIKEPLEVKESISGVELRLSPSQREMKYVESKAVDGGMLVLFEGHPKNVILNEVENSIGNFHVSHKEYSDSLMVWIKPQTANQNQSRRIQFAFETAEKSDTVSTYYEEVSDVQMRIQNDYVDKVPPLNVFTFKSNLEVKEINPATWVLKKDSLEVIPFTAEIDTIDQRRVHVNAQFEEDESYQLSVQKNTVKSYFHSIKENYRFDFEIDKAENFGSVTINLINKPESKFWIQLLDYNKEVQYETYTNESKITFNQLPAAQYYVRLLVDENENGFWDAASLEKKMHAEKSYVFYKIINSRPLWEIVEDWDLNSTKKLTTKITAPANRAPKKDREDELNQQFNPNKLNEFMNENSNNLSR